MRYKVVDGSATGHCCFKASVIDAESNQYRGDGTLIEGAKDVVCECFEFADAGRIAFALNMMKNWQEDGQAGQE